MPGTNSFMWVYQWRLLLNRNGHVIKPGMETEMKQNETA